MKLNYNLFLLLANFLCINSKFSVIIRMFLCWIDGQIYSITCQNMFQIFTHIIRGSNYKTAGLLASLPLYKLEWMEPHPLRVFLNYEFEHSGISFAATVWFVHILADPRIVIRNQALPCSNCAHRCKCFVKYSYFG